jgi:hypothetical protein
MSRGNQQGSTESPLSLFISCADADEPLCQQLVAHLSQLRRQGLIVDWYGRQILPGARWAEEIDAHLEAAQIVLLLISPDFLASEYCYNVEMRRALQRHENGETQVIPIILRPVDWKGAPFGRLQCLPHDGRAVTEWDNRDAAFHDVVRGIRTVTEQLLSISVFPQLVSVPSKVSATASTGAPVAPTDGNRQRMLKRVWATWIAGVLEQSLHGAALMVLGLEEKGDVLDNPWRLLMQEVDRPARLLPEGTHITQVYDATEGGLLILGDPGAGKTTLLLELARDLFDRAQTSENAPIPVVFNLSSWAKKRRTLSDWLIEELSIRYEVPRRLGQLWIREDRLLLLLDGLDEVASTARKECIETINSYRQAHPDVQVVVCSRSTEYLNESTQLRLHTAVVIQPLTQMQIDTYLESIGKQAEALRKALRQDVDLCELATTPLMLTILLFAYSEISPDQMSKLTSLETKREQIFASYVQRMLKRRGVSRRYKPEQITRWLAYLAQQMKRQNQTVFYIEQMQLDWLPKKQPRYVLRVLAAGVPSGLLGGLIGLAGGAIGGASRGAIGGALRGTPPIGATAPDLVAGLIIGLLLGLNLGFILGLFSLKSVEIKPAEVITFSWKNAYLAVIASIVGGSLGWPIAFLVMPTYQHFLSFISVPHSIYSTFIFGIVFPALIPLLIIILFIEVPFILISLFGWRNLDGGRFTISGQRIWSAARRGAIAGIYLACVGAALLFLSATTAEGFVGHDDMRYSIYLAAVGCVSGLVTGLVLGVSSGQLETHKSLKPNQGIWRSLSNGGRISLMVGFILWLIYDLPVLVSYGLAINQALPGETIDFPINQFLTGIIIAVSVGLFLGLLNGGIAALKHVMLRIFLRQAKALPWDCARFLDYAASRILLRKVGGGYIFVHRLLLEHFASLVTPSPKKASLVSARSDPSPPLSSTPRINITRREEEVSPFVPSRKTGLRGKKSTIVLFLVVFLILELVNAPTLFSIVQHYLQEGDNARARALVEADARATTQALTRRKVTAEEALAKASPIAYPLTNRSPVLDDPLQDNSKGNNWEVDNFENGGCKFINQAYDVSGYDALCIAKTPDFINFIYEVQMKIVKGNEGRIAFRIDPTSVTHNYYEFAINQDGTYSLHAYTPDNFDTVLAIGSNSAIHRGWNQTNLVAAVVHGEIIELYVNDQRVAAVIDSTSTHGWIGVGVAGFDNQTGAIQQTEVIFQNAKVWKL